MAGSTPRSPRRSRRMGTAKAVMADAKVVMGMSNNTTFMRPGDGGHAARIGACHPSRSYDVGMGRRDARRRGPVVRVVTGDDRDTRSTMNAPAANKVKVGFFSFTEITDPTEHHAYNEWHQLDHMPEQFPLRGIVYGQRWVSTPACRAARTASGPRLDAIHYMTLYLITEPVDETLQEFRQLGRDLYDAGRFHLHRHADLSGPFPLAATAVGATCADLRRGRSLPAASRSVRGRAGGVRHRSRPRRHVRDRRRGRRVGIHRRRAAHHDRVARR